MKAQPLKLVNGRYEPCSIEEVTHLRLHTPGPFSNRILPVIIKGTRKDTPNWSWNGDIEKPTLKPSILTQGGCTEKKTICHCFVNDGKIQFLNDCTHELAGQTLDLLDIE